MTEDNGYYRALKNWSAKPEHTVMLVPHYGPFGERAGKSLYYALIAYTIGAVLFLIIVVVSPFNEKRLRCFLTGERYDGFPDPPRSKVVKGKKAANDKLIIVRKTARQKLEGDLKQVCDLYNAEGRKMYFDLQQLDDTEFAVTFPYDIDFDLLCFMVNFLCYPMSGGDRAEVTGWTKAIVGDTWITEAIAEKSLMLYVPDDDQEHDNVYATTEDGKCYKFGFDGKTYSRSELCRPYQKPVIYKR